MYIYFMCAEAIDMKNHTLTKNHWLTLLLVALLMLSSCTSTTETLAEDTTVPADDTSAQTAETEPQMPLKKVDYDGKTFVFWTSPDITAYLWSEEITGEITADTMYETELMCEEYFNAVIQNEAQADTNNNTISDAVKTAVLAGDTSLHSAYGNVVNLAVMIPDNIFYDLNTVDAFDFTQPWWRQNSLEALTLAGHLYLGCSTITYAPLSMTHVFFANKQLLNQFGMDVPYDVVREGKWTLDHVISITKDIYVDTDGDGIRSETDTYGYLGSWWSDMFATSSNCSLMQFTGDSNILKIAADMDKWSSLVDTLYGWFYETDGALVVNRPEPIFVKGTGVFGTGSIADAASTLRNSEIDYAILPFPKYDENQDKYYSYARGFNFVIPVSVDDASFAGNILEGLAYYRYNYVIPAYNETAIKGKLSDAPEDAEMIQIIIDAMTEPTDGVYGHFAMGQALNYLMPEKNRNFVSWYQSNLSNAESQLTSLITYIQEQEG